MAAAETPRPRWVHRGGRTLHLFAGVDPCSGHLPIVGLPLPVEGHGSCPGGQSGGWKPMQCAVKPAHCKPDNRV